MSDSALLRCDHDYCSYETEDLDALAEHYAESSTNGTRWKCMGEGCGLKFCTTEALEDLDGHHSTCAAFQVFRVGRKYGQIMTVRLEMMSRRTDAQNKGLAPDGPVPGFSKASCKPFKKAKNDSKKTTPKPKEDQAKRKSEDQSKSSKVATSSKEDSEEESEVEVATEPKASSAGMKSHPTLKRKAKDEPCFSCIYPQAQGVAQTQESPEGEASHES